MPVPASVTTREVQGTYVDGAGNPQSGVISFRVDQPLIATVEEWGVVPGVITGVLNESGFFSVELMASSDIDLFPMGFRYLVQERFQKGYVRTYSIEVPSDSEPLDLPTTAQYDTGGVGLAIVHSINGRTGIVQLVAADLNAVPVSQKGVANGVATLDATGHVPVSQLPAPTAGVASVDGRTGVVSLTDLYAADDHTHTYPVTSVNGETGAVTLSAADVGAVSTAALAANSGVATLDSTGKLMGAQVPSLALTDVYDAADQAGMLTLPAQRGDLTRRTDQNKTYILTGTDPGILANWKEFLTPVAPVASVNGEVGVVVLNAADVDAVDVATRGAANGVASLDGGTRIPLAQIPNLPGAQITTGLINFDRLPTGSTSTTVSVGNHTHAYIPTADRGAVNGVAALDASTLVPVAQIPSLNTSKVTAGTFDIARIPTGTTGTTVSLGNHSHAAYVEDVQVGAASGVASLTADSRLPDAQLPLYTGRTVVLAQAAPLPSPLPVGTMVLRYTEDLGEWTTVTLEGVWSGTDVVPLTIA